MGYDCLVPVDKHTGVKMLTPPRDPLGAGQKSNITIANNLISFQYFKQKLCMQTQTINRYETNQAGF